MTRLKIYKDYNAKVRISMIWACEIWQTGRMIKNYIFGGIIRL